MACGCGQNREERLAARAERDARIAVARSAAAARREARKAQLQSDASKPKAA